LRRRRLRWLGGVGLLFSLIEAAELSGAHAQVRALGGCRFEATGAGQVARILDGRSFVLEDGREIRLSAIEVPPVPQAGESEPRTQAGTAAKAALEALLAGRSVQFAKAREAPDRYGRMLAHADVVIDDIPRPVEVAMVGAGHARVGAEIEKPVCAAELLSQERTARAAKLGLWADPYYELLGAENRTRLLAEQGHFSVIEGQVASVRESGGVIYVNFGRRWSEALTVTISKRHERIFTAAGLKLEALENRRLRVRGFIEDRNGPRIEATTPEQIEIVERN